MLPLLIMQLVESPETNEILPEGLICSKAAPDPGCGIVAPASFLSSSSQSVLPTGLAASGLIVQ
jgi:hypothetical protein